MVSENLIAKNYLRNKPLVTGLLSKPLLNEQNKLRDLLVWKITDLHFPVACDGQIRVMNKYSYPSAQRCISGLLESNA